MPFPRFMDGDVEIRFTKDGNEETYILHSHILACYSPWFEASLSARWNRGESSSTGSRHVLELRFEKKAGDGTLMRSTADDDSEMTQMHLTDNSFPADDELHCERKTVVKAHQSMFAALYHVTPVFGKNGKIWNSEAETAVLAFASASEYYGCGDATKIYVDHFLRKLSEPILRKSESDPYKMIKLGNTLEIDWIVKEAATYIVARDVTMKGPESGDMNEHPKLISLLRRKREQFVQRLKDVELDLLRADPVNSTTASQLACDYFRHWVAEMGPGYELNRGYAELYRLIAGSDPPPFRLTEVLIKKHFGEVGADADGKIIEYGEIGSRWEDVIDEVEMCTRDVVEDVTLLKSPTTMKSNLRFMTLRDEELPWKANN